MPCLKMPRFEMPCLAMQKLERCDGCPTLNQSVGSKLIAVLLENDRQIGLNPATKHLIAG